MDSLASRWRRLAPHIEHLAPPGDGPFATVLLFHGCGGVREHLRAYARAAVAAGWGAILIDSFGARGWSATRARYLVCTGLTFRGGERAGDVAATLHGVRTWKAVDRSRLVLAGWSHGGWAIMDLMAARLERGRELGLTDSHRLDLSGLRAAFLAYPYVGIAAASRWRRWPRPLRLLSIVPQRDHLASVRRHVKTLASAVVAGSDVEIWSVDATHAFDEPGLTPRWMQFDPVLGQMAIARFTRFLGSVTS